MTRPLPVAARAALAACVAAVALPGCEERPSCDRLDPATAWVEVGAGDESFEPLHEGDVMAVERGSQGGMHVWASLRTGGIDPGSEDIWEGIRNGDLPEVEFTLTGPHGRLTVDNERPTTLQRGDGEYLLLGQLTQFRHFEVLPDDWQDLDYAEVEAEMEGQDHVLGVRVLDRCGIEGTDEATVRLDFPERASSGDDDDSAL